MGVVAAAAAGMREGSDLGDIDEVTGSDILRNVLPITALRKSSQRQSVLWY